MTHSIKVDVHGGPRNPGKDWPRWSGEIQRQVERLLAYLKLEGEFVLIAVSAGSGHSQKRGLRALRYEFDHSGRTCISLQSQPDGNDSCWIYRLLLPSSTDPMLVYGQISIAIEEGRHLSDTKLRLVAEENRIATDDNVVPITHSVTVQREDSQQSEQSHVTPVFDVGKVQTDDELMVTLLSYIVDAARAKGNSKEVLYGDAVREIMNNLPDGCTNQHAGGILESFRTRRWITRDKSRGTISITDQGLRLVPPANASPLVAVESAAPTQPQRSFEDQIRHLRTLAGNYEKARALKLSLITKIDESETELVSLDSKRQAIIEELDAKRQIVTDQMRRYWDEMKALENSAQNSEGATASAELARIKALLSD